MSARTKAASVAAPKEGVSDEKGAEGEKFWSLSQKQEEWPKDKAPSMTALMDWAVERCAETVRGSRRGSSAELGFNLALQLDGGSVIRASFEDWAVKSETGRGRCVAKLSEWVRRYKPMYMVVFCDMRGRTGGETAKRAAVIGVSADASWARIYDRIRLASEARIVAEQDGPADGIWVDAFQDARRMGAKAS